MSRPLTTEFSRVGPFLVLTVIVLTLYFARELLIPFASRSYARVSIGPCRHAS